MNRADLEMSWRSSHCSASNRTTFFDTWRPDFHYLANVPDLAQRTVVAGSFMLLAHSVSIYSQRNLRQVADCVLTGEGETAITDASAND